MLICISTVSTASHGGMMISPTAAIKYLSESARKRALMHNDYYCYEEDGDYYIPIFDTKELRPLLLEGREFWNNKTDQEIELYLIETLSNWHPDFLIEKHVKPDETLYKQWLLRKEADVARAAKSPLLVTSCFNSSHTLIANVIKVSTADGKAHYVTNESYTEAMNDKSFPIFPSLNYLTVLDQSTLPPLQERLIQYAIDISKPYLLEIKNKTQSAVKEASGNWYGPRSRFNGSMESAKDALTRHLLENVELSWKEAENEWLLKIKEIHKVIHAEFNQCRIFKVLDVTLKHS